MRKFPLSILAAAGYAARLQLLAASALMIAVPMIKAHAAPTALGVNLIVNGGAEAGPGAPSDALPLMDIPGWQRTGNFEVTQYGASGGFTDKTDPGPDDRGKNFFNGGPNNPKSSATQTDKITGLDALIDKHQLAYAFSAFIGGYSNQNDHATVTVEFRSVTGHPLGTAQLGPLMAADRNDKTGLFPRSTSGSVPAGTREVTVTIVIVRTDGSYNDGCADNLSLVLKKKGAE
jgi:hypothetical protein